MSKIECTDNTCRIIEHSSSISMAHGSGGEAMQQLISTITKEFYRGEWKNTDNDGATKDNLVFTSDSFVVTPLEFPGGNIGKLAFCGTVNDLAVMGAKPLALSLSLIIEEGTPLSTIKTITQTISDLSNEHKIPIVTGDTKVMEKGSLDKIIINTAGIGISNKPLTTKLEPEDVIIVSGGLGEHAAALLAKRFELQTDIVSDCKPLHKELEEIAPLIKQAKDITRGGLAAITNELAQKEQVQIILEEKHIPVKKQVNAIIELLGLELFPLACEGRFLCVAKKENAAKVLEILKTYNSEASIIGTVKEGSQVFVQTIFGKRILPQPTGNIVPRIC